MLLLVRPRDVLRQLCPAWDPERVLRFPVTVAREEPSSSLDLPGPTKCLTLTLSLLCAWPCMASLLTVRAESLGASEEIGRTQSRECLPAWNLGTAGGFDIPLSPVFAQVRDVCVA